MDDLGERIMYSGDGEGHWWRREWKAQCAEKVFLAGQCQGVVGHDDVHWCYGPNGSLYWQNPKKDLKPTDISAGQTPPGHATYRTPEEMQQHYHLSHSTATEVTDPKILAMLDQDQTPEPGASLNRPVRE
jgi:hypothetical protein